MRFIDNFEHEKVKSVWTWMKDCYPKKSSSLKRGRNGSALIRPIWLESGTSGIATKNFCHTIEALIHFMAFMEELLIITTKLKNSGESLLSIILIAKNQWGIGPKKKLAENTVLTVFDSLSNFLISYLSASRILQPLNLRDTLHSKLKNGLFWSY